MTQKAPRKTQLRLLWKWSLAAVAISGLYFMIHSDVTKAPVKTVVSIPLEHPAPAPQIFDPDEVIDFAWTQNGKTRHFRKSDGKWKSSEGAPSWDPWGIQRRIMIFSRLPLRKNYSLSGSIGRIVLKTPRAVFEGIFTKSDFMWESGPEVGSGFNFEQNPDLAAIFEEGLLGFLPHTVSLCNPDKLTEVNFKAAHWKLSLSAKKWLVIVDSQQPQPARAAALTPWLKSFCAVVVDQFMTDASGSEVPILELKQGGEPPVSLSEKSGFFVASARPIFKSRALENLLKIQSDDLKDPSLEEARIALDGQKSVPERLAAIRKIKEMKSPEGIPALKLLVNENTDIDVFRYEAVDALAAIGTSEAIKIIADRLNEVGRSGFQLRLARALSSIVGYPFTSDERTPESVRQNDVQDLLNEYKKNPAKN